MTMEQQIQQQVKQLDEKVNKVDGNVSQILMIMVGNSFDKDDKGLIGQVNNHENRMQKMERRFEIFIAKGIGIGIGVSLMAGVGLREIIALIFKE